MPRRSIPFLSNQYYHFYNRGNNRQAIFFERGNYLYFLKGVQKYLVPYVDVLVYSLMPTHYHLLGRVRQTIKTSEFLENSEVLNAEVLPPEVLTAKVSMAMMRLGVSYTKAINKRFGRVGALFQGQFQAKPVQSYEHLLNLCVYIHGNPVKDGLVSLPENWEYANYLEWMGLRKGTLVDHDFIEQNFGSPPDSLTQKDSVGRVGGRKSAYFQGNLLFAAVSRPTVGRICWICGLDTPFDNHSGLLDHHLQQKCQVAKTLARPKNTRNCS
ncbi:MAG: transposase [Chloroflexota bacterium]